MNDFRFARETFGNIADDLVDALSGDDVDIEATELRVYTMRVGTVLAGLAIWRLDDHPEYPGRWGFLHAIWIRPEYRGVDLGVVAGESSPLIVGLLARSEDELHREGAHALEAQVSAADEPAFLSLDYLRTRNGMAKAIKFVQFNA